MLAIVLLAAACSAGNVQVYGTAEHDGVLEVYPAGVSVPTTVKLTAGKKWTVCVAPTVPVAAIDPAGPYVPWFDEVQFAYSGAKPLHERWAIPSGVKSLPVSKVVTDGILY